jgi:hypothetical protein
VSKTKRYSQQSQSEIKPKRVFSLPEAQRSLVLIKRIVTDVIFEYSRMIELQEQLEAAEEAEAVEQSDLARMDLIRSAGRLRTCLDELDDVGVELKDWALGVVDFPSFAAGRAICLCWQYGQDRIEYWHEVDATFADRQPIADLPDSAEFLQTAARGGSEMKR